MNGAGQKVLVVEDDEGLRSQMRWALSDYDVALAGCRAEALEKARAAGPKVVILDLGMPPDPDGASEGLAALEEILALDPAAKVIVATGNEERENAIRAVALGAYDFCAKPVDIDILKLTIERAIRLYDLEIENKRLHAAGGGAPFDGLIAESPAMLRICQGIEKVAQSDVSVLLTGESGTGKDVLARAIHQLSPREQGPFVAINCAAIPENLLESELFGHERGAFTGAIKQTVGKIEKAEGGTLFLDEIAEMPLPLQVKLLRFLQDRTIERIGGRRQIAVDVRIVSATNASLEEAIAEGRFREDLYYRLNEVAFALPPLRSRNGDALLIARQKLHEFNGSLRKAIGGIGAEASEAIMRYNWPGNVRELENRLKRAMVLCEGKYITAEDLDLPQDGTPAFPTLKMVREEAETEIVNRALHAAGHNISYAAKLLGVSRPTLYELMKSYGLK